MFIELTTDPVVSREPFVGNGGGGSTGVVEGTAVLERFICATSRVQAPQNRCRRMLDTSPSLHPPSTLDAEQIGTEPPHLQHTECVLALGKSKANDSQS